MARLTRQQLKKDEFVSRFETIQEFALQNQRQIIIVVLSAVLTGSVILGGFLYVRSRQSRASGEFADALANFHAQVSPTPPPNSTAPHFKTNPEKYEQALKQFSEVAERYSWYSQGKLARFYAALCKLELERLPQAENDLNTIAAGRDEELAALAKLALASHYKQTGKNDEAEKLYRDLEEHPTGTVPKATAQLELADLYQRTKPAQAAEIYKKLQTEYPGMAAGDLASKMLQGQ